MRLKVAPPSAILDALFPQDCPRYAVTRATAMHNHSGKDVGRVGASKTSVQLSAARRHEDAAPNCAITTSRACVSRARMTFVAPEPSPGLEGVIVGWMIWRMVPHRSPATTLRAATRVEATCRSAGIEPAHVMLMGSQRMPVCICRGCKPGAQRVRGVVAWDASTLHGARECTRVHRFLADLRRVDDAKEWPSAIRGELDPTLQRLHRTSDANVAVGIVVVRPRLTCCSFVRGKNTRSAPSRNRTCSTHRASLDHLRDPREPQGQKRAIAHVADRVVQRAYGEGELGDQQG